MTAPVCPTPDKVAFTSERAAKRALRQAGRYRAIRRPHGRMYAYRCGAHWHLGHGRRNREVER